MASHIGRRELLAALGGAAAAWPLAARAQTAASMRSIGVLTALAENDVGWQRNFAGFVAGLSEKGWLEGRSFRFLFRMSPAATWTIFEWRQESLYHSRQT